MIHNSRISVRFLVLFILGFWVVVCLGQSAQPKRGSVDWILVLDTSASMHGAEGAANIFDRVKSTLAEFVRATHQGDSVALYTFDNDTQLRSDVRIMTEMDKLELLKIIYDLQSNGTRTYTGKAIHDALSRATELNERTDAGDRTVSIVLFTDGLEDVRGIPSPISIPSNVSLIPKEQPYLFFVSLGKLEHEKQLEDFVKSPEMGNRGDVVRDPGASRIEEVAESIRKTIEARPSPKEVKITAEPISLDFGKAEPGAVTARQKLIIRSDGNIPASLNVDSNAAVTLVEPNMPLELKAGQNTFDVSLRSPARIADGTYNIHLNLNPNITAPSVTASPISINASLTIAHVPLWHRAIKWLALLLGLAILVVGAMSVIKGEPPWIWLGGLRPDRKLEGEVEVIQPRPARPEDEYISLTHQQSERVSLKSLIPATTTSKSDGELIAIRRNGQKSIRLIRTEGVVCVNKIEISTLDLYDGDVIEFDEARLRFNWIGHDRPIAPEEET